MNSAEQSIPAYYSQTRENNIFNKYFLFINFLKTKHYEQKATYALDVPIVFYDGDKNYIAPAEAFSFTSLTNAEPGAYKDIPVPENAVYVMFSGGNRLISGDNRDGINPYIEFIPYGEEA